GRELVAAPPVELLDRAVETQRSLLDQIQKRDAETAVALRDRHDEAQVRLDHAPLGDRVAALDLLGERDLLRCGEELVATDVGEEQLERVGGTRERLGSPHLGLRGLLFLLLLLARALRRADLETDGLELALQRLGFVLVELVLEDERLELR